MGTLLSTTLSFSLLLDDFGTVVQVNQIMMIRIKFIMHYSNLVQEIFRVGNWSLEDAYRQWN